MLEQVNALRKAEVDARAARVAAHGRGAGGGGGEAGKGLHKSSDRSPGASNNRNSGALNNRSPGGPGGRHDPARPNTGHQRRGQDREQRPGGHRQPPGGTPGGSQRPGGPGPTGRHSGGSTSGSGSGSAGGRGLLSKGDGVGSKGADSAKAERTRLREQRLADRQAADLADRTKDRDRDRNNKQTLWDDKRHERNAERERRRRDAEARAGEPGLAGRLFTTVKSKLKRGGSGDGDAAAGAAEEATAKPADSADTSGAPEEKPGTEKPDTEKPDAGFGAFKPGDRFAEFLAGLYDPDASAHSGKDADPEPELLFTEPVDMAPAGASAVREEDIPDAEIVVDALPAKGPDALPPAPEPHTERPGTYQPAARVRGGSAGRRGFARQHATDITLDEILVALANVTVDALKDHELSQASAAQLNALAQSLAAMCDELLNDHNLTKKLVNLIGALRDLVVVTAREANRLTEACEKAAKTAHIAAAVIAKEYEKDKAAMADGGLDQASAAVHHA
ncbi:hypothetical protein [Kitasatospora sp. NPDC088134]|uniref:hypothetical protein n=1 Tax=Kitasatospora sp. NPDC088134 TaxID=3364071 RepID=UPI0038019FCC